LKKTHHKKRAGGVTQDVGPEFKPQYCKKKKRERERERERERTLKNSFILISQCPSE
jgi:hypothetical protein